MRTKEKCRNSGGEKLEKKRNVIIAYYTLWFNDTSGSQKPKHDTRWVEEGSGGCAGLGKTHPLSGEISNARN